MYSLGIDIGSSSVKVSLMDIADGTCLASSTNPSTEMPIKAVQPGWAEQDPEMWWNYVCEGIRKISQTCDIREVACIGITYQMHGLVVMDKDKKVLRDSIIWCDSRAVEIGEAAAEKIGRQHCLEHFLNSPGNFTASKLSWVKENEPEIFSKSALFFLPGDYIAYRLTGETATTEGGLSEQILWDFKAGDKANEVLDCYGIPEEKVPETVPSIGIQCRTNAETEKLLGIKAGTPVSYRAGDQPNNAFSLNVLQPGEIAATAGTSGVVYGVTDQAKADPVSRVNTFLHVNHRQAVPRYGVLLCISGTGIMNAWVRKNMARDLSYEEMNQLAANVSPGSEGVLVHPFGNGAERVLENCRPGASISGLDLNRHHLGHLIRATQEGIAYAFRYGIDIMKGMGLAPKVIRAGKANLFLSDVFVQTLATLTSSTIELYNTDGALGAARGAALGAGFYKNREEAFASLKKLETVEPQPEHEASLAEAYAAWKKRLPSTQK